MLSIKRLKAAAMLERVRLNIEDLSELGKERQLLLKKCKSKEQNLQPLFSGCQWPLCHDLSKLHKRFFGVVDVHFVLFLRWSDALHSRRRFSLFPQLLHV